MFRIAGWIAGLLAGPLLYVAFAPIPEGPTPSPRAPARDYAEAVERVGRSILAEERAVSVYCRPRLLGHGERTGRAVVLLHGFTNCPKQFDSLATLFYARGMNVYQPRVPRHGLANRMTTALASLTAEELTRSAEDALDVAHGLGERVTIVGLSSTAVAAAWLAVHRDDLDQAIVIAPAFTPRKVGLGWTKRLTSALLLLPNFFAWWDSKAKEEVGGPKQCYPRFASRGLGQVYRLGFAALAGATAAKPAAREVVILTTAADEGVGNGAAHELARRWRAHRGNVVTYEFPESLGVHHDMIDPEQPYQRIEVSYPEILRAVGP
jgi:pimeloyl-ACP methyl ester carboxylesterase